MGREADPCNDLPTARRCGRYVDRLSRVEMLLLEYVALRQQLALYEERHANSGREGDRAFWSLLAGR